MLEENFYLRYKTSAKLPLDISDVTKCKAFKQFQAQINNIIKHLDYICYCYTYCVDIA